jgi:Fic family protein
MGFLGQVAAVSIGCAQAHFQMTKTDMDIDWAELDRKRRHWASLQPSQALGLDHWINVELTYTSNAIEGNTLTRIETALVLEKGLTVSGKPLRDHLEAVGHLDALNYIRVLAARKEPLREGDIREIHRLVMARADPDDAGCYSTRQRFIAGSTVRLPTPIEIPIQMSAFAAWLAGSEASPRTAIEAHERLVSIHPFSDGNGRTARLLMNLILLKADYPPLIVGPEDRPTYISSLEALQLGKGGEAYWKFMAERLEASIDLQIKMLEGA